MKNDIMINKIQFDGTTHLVPAIAQDYKTGKVLMVAYQNREALEKTIKTGDAWYFSRSRNELWHKGETSGNTQKVTDIKADCDNDTILMLVEQKGGIACHRGTNSCFD